MLNPNTPAGHETEQFNFRYHPLRFPVGEVAASSAARSESRLVSATAWEMKSASYLISSAQQKKQLISALEQFLVTNGQLSVDEGKDFAFWLRSQAASMPMLAARLDNDQTPQPRSKRALLTERDPRVVEHIKNHCLVEEEVLKCTGRKPGKTAVIPSPTSRKPISDALR